MNIKLIRKLTEMGIIRENTEIEAFYYGVDLSGNPLTRTKGTFYIQGIRVAKEAENATLVVLSTVDGSKSAVKSENVLTVDGMPIERLAGIYGIDATGCAISQGKRRGRRPRQKLVA
jgi:hypothetical protein